MTDRVPSYLLDESNNTNVKDDQEPTKETNVETDVETDVDKDKFVPCSYLHIPTSSPSQVMVIPPERIQYAKRQVGERINQFYKYIWTGVVVFLVFCILGVSWKIWFLLFPIKKIKQGSGFKYTTAPTLSF